MAKTSCIKDYSHATCSGCGRPVSQIGDGFAHRMVVKRNGRIYPYGQVVYCQLCCRPCGKKAAKTPLTPNDAAALAAIREFFEAKPKRP